MHRFLCLERFQVFAAALRLQDTGEGLSERKLAFDQVDFTNVRAERQAERRGRGCRRK